MFRRLLKWLLGLFLVLVLFVAVAFVHVWYFKPLSIDWFFARTAMQFVLDSPQTLSQLRILKPLGLEYYQDDLDQAGPEETRATLAKAMEARETLLRYDDEDLSPEQLRSKQVALYLMNIVKDGERFMFHNYPVNQMSGVQSGLPSFMESAHSIEDEGDAEDYIARLEQFPRRFAQTIEGLQLREERDILPPRFVAEKVLTEMRGFTGPVEENILYSSFVDKLDGLDLEDARREELLAEVHSSIEDSVYPAYGELITYFEGLLPKLEGNYGVWALPDGDEFYRLALRFFTTTDLSPEEIHQHGLAEVDRIQGEMLQIMAGQGIDTGAGFSTALAQITEDPDQYYEDSEAGREELLQAYRDIISEIESDLDEAFDKQPQAEVEVRAVPEFKAATAPGAYYQQPSMDGSRPGMFFANLNDMKASPKFGLRTLAYHEAVPGHHFQIALAQENEALPFFRRMSLFTAYTEGWALYSERLAWELGFQEDPLDNLGRLQAELFRAVRLVVDTGIHHKRWTRQRAIDYMRENTGQAPSDVEAEIDRYFVLPGQACAYKVGMDRILDLRERARNELGDDFSLSDFHEVVLGHGALPLVQLELVVDDYIEDTRQSH